MRCRHGTGIASSACCWATARWPSATSRRRMVASALPSRPNQRPAHGAIAPGARREGLAVAQRDFPVSAVATPDARLWTRMPSRTCHCEYSLTICGGEYPLAELRCYISGWRGVLPRVVPLGWAGQSFSQESWPVSPLPFIKGRHLLRRDVSVKRRPRDALDARLLVRRELI